jgi:HAD superfamily hydrolase (TIGR01509 family)
VIKHIIFDCDGVLVDSEPLSARADMLVLQRFGIDLTPGEIHRRFVGTTFTAMAEILGREHGVDFPEGLQAVKNQLISEMYLTELQIVAGLRPALEALTARGITCSVASNSPAARVELALRLTGISDFFIGIISYEEVGHPKPAPDVFLRAVEKSGHAGKHCLVVEDSPTGVTAAVAAGLKTYGFTGTQPNPAEHGKSLTACGAAQLFRHMAELPNLVA